MKTLGIDIGTTSVSAAVAMDGELLESMNVKNDSFIGGSLSCERIQDVKLIEQTALEAAGELLAKHPDIAGIGLTGQMHGIVYLDGNGAPVSPLYTWQDGRGDLDCGGETWAERLGRLTGYRLATGFGTVTHYYNTRNGLVPDNAAVFCAVHDYIAMRLAGRQTPVTDVSDAASFGLFDVKNGVFDTAAMEKAGLGASMLPRIASVSPIGMYDGRIRVYPAIGDNQASFIGACGGRKDVMLCNVGTGGQFSVYSADCMECPGLETRPFPGGGYLLVGSALCSGRAYAILEKFFRAAGKMLGFEAESCYGAMEALLESSPKPDDIPAVTPLFSGTRGDPSLRGSISGISEDNFTPLHLIYGTMYGIAGELYVCTKNTSRLEGRRSPLSAPATGFAETPFCVSALRKYSVRSLSCRPAKRKPPSEPPSLRRWRGGNED